MRLPGDIDLRLAAAVWHRNLAVYKRTWITNILPNFFEPVLYLVGMGLGLGMYMSQGVGGQDYVVYIAPGLMAAAAMNGASFEVSWNMFVKMNFGRLYDAYLTTPAHIQDIAFGELMWAVTRALIYGLGFAAVLIPMTLMGYPILNGWWPLALPLALALVGAMFAVIGATYTSFVRVIDMYSYYWTLFLTPLFLFSGIFFKLGDMPNGHIYEAIAWWTPLYHGVRLVQDLCASTVGWRTVESAVWMLVVTLVLTWLLPRLLKRRLLS